MDSRLCFYCDAYPWRIILVRKFVNCRLAIADPGSPTESVWGCDVTTENLCCRRCFGGGDPDLHDMPSISVVTTRHDCSVELWWNQELQDMIDDPGYNDGVRSELRLKLRRRLFPKP